MATFGSVLSAGRTQLTVALRPRFSLRSLFLTTLIVALGLAACQLANLRFPYVYTGRALDVSIDGAGYFQVAGEFDEKEIRYTRGGRFWIDSDLQIRVSNPELNLHLYPVITLPSDGRAIIDEFGNAYAENSAALGAG